jgi:hypothetical protein
MLEDKNSFFMAFVEPGPVEGIPEHKIDFLMLLQIVDSAKKRMIIDFFFGVPFFAQLFSILYHVSINVSFIHPEHMVFLFSRALHVSLF